MPLFRALGERGCAKARPKKKRRRNQEWMESRCKTDHDGSIYSLTRLCLLSLADNMKELWTKDYADKYVDHYSFRHIMRPFNSLPGDLVEELMMLLCARKKLSRAALHLLLVPQLRCLSLERCPGLVTSALCTHITARCQGLWSLDLSGAQQLSSRVLCETLHSLPALRSLCLAGMPCDRNVIMTITRYCRLLRHLDVSHCHLLPPSALLFLGVELSWSSSASPSCSSLPFTTTSNVSGSSSCSDLASYSFPTLSPLPLYSLLALDIGFGEEEGDPVAAAAYLFLSLPYLERVGMDGVAQACCLIEHREFNRADELTSREGVPRLEEVWRERRLIQDRECWRKTTEAVDKEEEVERMLWEGCSSESEEEASEGSGPSSSQNQAKEDVLSQSGLILRLRDVKSVTCDSLDSFGRLCPGVSSLSVNMTENNDEEGQRRQGSLLTAGLQTWSGQLRCLAIQFPGPLENLLPALQVAGFSLISLTLEGVKISSHTPLVEVVRACPKLKELLISADPTRPRYMGTRVENDPHLPRLPDLCTLSLNFSFEDSPTKPVIFSIPLTNVLWSLLSGSPLLKKLSLVSLPCPLDIILQRLLRVVNMNMRQSADFANLPVLPLRMLQHVDLLRTDIRINTLKSLMEHSTGLQYVDVSYCWHISQLEWRGLNTFSKTKIVWK